MNHIQTSRGFTLIELMITIVVSAILLAIAVPSFNEFRQRAALRGAADQVVSFWGDARFEALRRNQMVKVGFKTDATNGMCIGAAITTNVADNVACDCFTAGSCGISAFPSSQDEWRRMGFDGLPTIGDTDTDADGVIVIDPKRGNITENADTGRIFLKTPASSSANYRLNIDFDRNGRAVICEPLLAPNKLPQFTDRRC